MRLREVCDEEKAVAVLLLFRLLLSSCPIPLKETGTAEEKTETASVAGAGTRESVPEMPPIMRSFSISILVKTAVWTG